MKQCSKCNEVKPYEFFSKSKGFKDGFQYKCKSCEKQYREENKEKIKEYKKQYNEENKEKIKEKIKKWREENKEKIKEYYQENKERKREYDKEYRQENKEKIKKYREENKERRREHYKEWFKERIKIDFIFKFKHNVRNNIKNSFKRGKNQFRKDAKTEEILGCTIEEFRLYIESKFQKGMTLENYGEWHLDHIIPLASAETKKEIIKLNHYTNFQPLWAEENLSKGSKIEETQLKLI